MSRSLCIVVGSVTKLVALGLTLGWVFSCGGSNDAGLTGPIATVDSGSGGSGGVGAGGTGAGSGTGGGGALDGGAGDAGQVTEPCDSDRDCTPAGKLCDLTRARCVECMSNAPCAAGYVCSAGICLRSYPCADSRDCVGAPDSRAVCEPATGQCVECVRSADCAANYECVANRCVVVGTCVPQGCAGRCGSVDDGCGAPIDCGACANHCTDGIQNADETGIDCGGIDCTACPVPTGAWARCTADTDCVDGRICSKQYQELFTPGRWGFCTLSCPTNTECTDPALPGGETPICIGSGLYCVIPCTATGVCPDTMECVSGPTGNVCRHALM